MKYLIAILLSLTANYSYATFPEFEPSLFCGAAGAAAYVYSGSKSGNQMAYAGIACALGYMVGDQVNGHYKDKYSKEFDAQIKQMNQIIDQFNKANAEASFNQKEGPYYRVRTRVIKGAKLPNGSVRAPTLETYIEEPGTASEDRVGN